jgi:16S rRNA (cytidine1402-2'-O)-methyltransferase
MSLVLIPTPLGADDPLRVLPPATIEAVHGITTFAVEQLPAAVKFLSRIGHPVPSYSLTFLPYSKRSTPQDLMAVMKALDSGDVGVMSEAGAPGVADPGTDLVWMAHQRGIPVRPLMGPSAVLLSVMASGLNGQRFAFNGYLPVKTQERADQIRHFESHSAKTDQAQFFIEAPHRNQEVWTALINTLQADTKLGYAQGLNGEDESILTREVSQWRRSPALVRNGIPAMFMLLAQGGR